MKHLLLLLWIINSCFAYAQPARISRPATPTFATPTPADLSNYGYALPHSDAPVNTAGKAQARQEGAEQHRAGQEQLQEVYQELRALKGESENNRQEQLRQQAYQYAVGCYQTAFTQLEAMLEGKEKLNLKRAVFLTENAFGENKLPYADFERPIGQLVARCRNQANKQIHSSKNSGSHLALYQVLCDTTLLFDAAGKKVGWSLPMQYDFEDYMGEAYWTKMFVSKLLRTKSGNCHSLPLLYKILADELQLEAFLSFAPNHSYIQHRDSKGTWFNLELTNRRYVSETFLMASGYIKASALKNRIYLDTLSLRQTVAHCLVDLAQGYTWKFGPDAFVIRCCELALRYYPNDIHALMAQADVYSLQFRREVRQAGSPPPEQLPNYPQLYALYQRRNALYDEIERLGYISMPQAQYEAWLKSVEQEKQKASQR